MKKLFLSILVICSLLGGNAYAEKIDVFKCKPKNTKYEEQAENNFNFQLISTQSKTQKFIRYNSSEDVALANVIDEEALKNYQINNYKSYHQWVTYEYDFWSYFPEAFTVTTYTLTERKKDGKLVLAGTIITTSEYYYNEFLESKIKRKKNKEIKNEYLKMFSIDTLRMGTHHGQRLQDSQNVSSSVSRAFIGWDCLKQ